jgi:peptidoglycan-associated lipoprotein
MTAEQQAAAEAEAARAQAERDQMKQQQAAEDARMRQDASTMSAEARRRRFGDEDIHFDFDKYVLKAEAMMLLDEKAAYLRENRNARVLIEGHCDERGSNEYNLALGDRRANSAANYLIRSGVAADRLTTVSYGEEQPICMQSNESCWSRNRRAHFVLR